MERRSTANKMALGLGLLGLALGAAQLLALATKRIAKKEALRASELVRDYGGRSGFPLPPQAMRGSARDSFETPDDMRAPLQMRPFEVAEDVSS